MQQTITKRQKAKENLYGTLSSAGHTCLDEFTPANDAGRNCLKKNLSVFPLTSPCVCGRKSGQVLVIWIDDKGKCWLRSSFLA